jgi:hypothetical protein
MRYVNLTPAAATQIVYKALFNETHNLHKVDLELRELILCPALPSRKVTVDLLRFDQLNAGMKYLRGEIDSVGGLWSVQVKEC